MSFVFADYQESVDFIRARIGHRRPEIAMILGSGLGDLGNDVEDAVAIPFGEIPHFHSSTAPGHKGRLIFGTLEGRPVAVMQGRIHYYEGCSYEEVAFPARVLALLGCRTLVVTNASGAVNLNYEAGDLMLIRDHIKLFTDGPLRGPNLPEFGCRFPDCSYLYTPRLRQLARDCAAALDIPLREGVYMYWPGPQYETPAEVRLARLLCADAVGMSTVPEVLAAAHAGMEILGLSLISNMAAGILDQPLTEQEVLDAGVAARDKFSRLVLACLKQL